MSVAKKDDTVKVHYTGTLDNGEIFDSSIDRDPLEFKLGSKNVIPGFEAGVLGMKVGEKKLVKIPSKNAYGEVNDQLVMKVPNKDVPDNIKPEVGLQLQMKQPDGNVVNVMITEVTDESITLDANHPLAGKQLTFDIELIEIS